MRRKIVKGKYLRVGVTSHPTRLHCSADRVGHANFNPDLEVPSCFEANMEAMHDRNSLAEGIHFQNAFAFYGHRGERVPKESYCLEISTIFVILVIYISKSVALGMKY